MVSYINSGGGGGGGGRSLSRLLKGVTLQSLKDVKCNCCISLKKGTEVKFKGVTFLQKGIFVNFLNSIHGKFLHTFFSFSLWGALEIWCKLCTDSALLHCQSRKEKNKISLKMKLYKRKRINRVHTL